MMQEDERLRVAFEQSIDQPRFSMSSLVTGIFSLNHSLFSPTYPELVSALGQRTGTAIFRGLIRSSFLIELVKLPGVETTKFEVRWAERVDGEDPRYARFAECLAVYQALWAMLKAAFGDQTKLDLLQTFVLRQLLPYELPIDYLERVPPGESIHSASNVVWLWGEVPHRTSRLRRILMDESHNENVSLFERVYDKVRVKTYLTDRVLTGTYKTNREKRWEVHPRSVHFAYRRSCFDIEFALINQLCHFDGFPESLVRTLEEEELLVSMEAPARCPITLDPLSFDEFSQSILAPSHGRSNFQVGHLNPLKATIEDPQSGHTAENISWISSDGNRIQGHLSLAEVRILLARIQRNYQDQMIKPS